jgi:hypothetical protein
MQEAIGWTITRTNLDELSALIDWLQQAASAIASDGDIKLFIAHHDQRAEILFYVVRIRVDWHHGADFIGDPFVVKAHSRIYEYDGERYWCPCPECKARRGE